MWGALLLLYLPFFLSFFTALQSTGPISHWSKEDWEVLSSAPWQRVWDLRGSSRCAAQRCSYRVMPRIKLRKQPKQFNSGAFTVPLLLSEESVKSCHENSKKKAPDGAFLATVSWTVTEDEGPCQPLDQIPPFNQAIRAESDNWRFIFAGPASIWQQHQRSCEADLASCAAFIT